MFPTAITRSAPQASQVFKRSQAGLFGGKIKQYGNNVPHSKHKTRRAWLPNVQTKRLYSETLGDTMKTKVTARALRTIDKYGGLDGWLMNAKISSLGDKGLEMRERILEVRERELAQRKKEAAVAAKAS
ncbi:39S ribosomal protein L24, mitochondrial [Tulasnella sp. 403]|nr:39S ribosomal protein L24, mitochondrial [Tulasnella sp. 403]